MTYFTWCRPFHYKHYFSDLYNLPIKMCFWQEIQQHVPALQEEKKSFFSHFIQFWPVILSLSWVNTGWASDSTLCLSHLFLYHWILPCMSMKCVGTGQNLAHPEVWLMTETIPNILTAGGHRRHHKKPGKQSLLQRVCALIEQSRQTKRRKKGNNIIPPPFIQK